MEEKKKNFFGKLTKMQVIFSITFITLAVVAFLAEQFKPEKEDDAE